MQCDSPGPGGAEPGRAVARRAALALAGALLLLAWLPLVVGAAETRLFEIELRERQVKGPRTLRVTRGDTVRLVWRSDEAVDLHLHGYDIELVLSPGAPGVMEFTARATGRFPVSSHGFGAAAGQGGAHGGLLYLEVHPE